MDCFAFGMGEWGTCHGCDPKCPLPEEHEKEGYPPRPVDDSHLRCLGLHHAIYKVLESRLQLKRADITRLATYYHGPSKHTPLLEDGSNYYFEVMVVVRKGAFFIGALDRECEGNIKHSIFYKGWLWIGQTKYEIWSF